ncbi:hypothetical protein V2J09_008290 [Rumex salicifolius]
MKSKPLHPIEHKRDAYGFAVRPQHLQRYREYASIYKEEEEERSDRWNIFLEQLTDPAQAPISSVTLDEIAKNDNKMLFQDDTTAGNHQEAMHKDVLNAEKSDSGEGIPKKMSQTESVQEKRVHRIQIWSNIRPSLHAIEDLMSIRVKKMDNVSCNGHSADAVKPLHSGEEVRFVKGASEEDSEEEFYDVERSDPIQDGPLGDSPSFSVNVGTNNIPHLACNCPWKEELEVLVRGGVPMALRGELWQAFVGVKTRRREKYYQDLLSLQSDSGYCKDQEVISSNEQNNAFHEKYKGQIEKDLPRTFPGHPALDEDGRNALRRLLIAYARHNPSVGYCQAMNFFAGLLLLLMPEENAFWSLLGILDDYFDGYYSEDMIECQVDQLVFEDLVRERFPKLVNHLDYLGVQIAWVTGPWFLSIFMNMLPWETVLRVWDVLLFEGSRVMLFRTALALMELYGPALVTAKDAGDAVTLLQSLAGSTFDSSQLVLTACMGFQNVNEARLKELGDKHRPAVMVAIEERSKGLYALKNSKGLASKLYTFKSNAVSSIIQPHKSKIADEHSNGDTEHLESGSTTPDEYAVSLAGDIDIDPGLDTHEQVELCKLLEEKCSAELRADELEAALMEMVKQDNRRELSAKVLLRA